MISSSPRGIPTVPIALLRHPSGSRRCSSPPPRSTNERIIESRPTPPALLPAASRKVSASCDRQTAIPPDQSLPLYLVANGLVCQRKAEIRAPGRDSKSTDGRWETSADWRVPSHSQPLLPRCLTSRRWLRLSWAPRSCCRPVIATNMSVETNHEQPPRSRTTTIRPPPRCPQLYLHHDAAGLALLCTAATQHDNTPVGHD